MGSDKKSKEKRKRNSDDEEKSKRHRDAEEKSRKSDEKKKRKDKKSHKHRSGDEKKSKDKSKSKSLRPDHPLKHDIQELSTDDYFAKNNEFSTWLKEEKRVFFSDLSSESAREMFADFVNAWNKQKLDSRYYEGIVSGPRTAHNWKIRQ